MSTQSIHSLVRSIASTYESNYLVYGPQNTVVWRTKKLKPKLNHLLVKVKACGVNPVDAKHSIGDKLPKRMENVSNWLVKGVPVGFEFAGEVMEPGDRTSIYKKGDNVYGSMPPLGGTFASYILVPEHHVSRKPSALTFEEASCLPLVGLTALQALKEYTALGGAEKPAKSICIVGASGGTGHVGVQVAKVLGFSTIVGICSTANLEFVQSLGATHVIDYTKETVVDDLKAIVGDGVDIVFDCVTSGDPADQAPGYPQDLLPLTKTRYIRLGGNTGDWGRALGERFGMKVFQKEKLFWIRFPNTTEELKLLKVWCDENKLKPVIEKTVPFTKEGVEEAFADILGRRVKGKLVLTMESEEEEGEKKEEEGEKKEEKSEGDGKAEDDI